MSLTLKGAYDEMFSAINADWQTKTTAVVGYIPPIQWPGFDTGEIPDAAKFWGRISTQGVSSAQSTLSENVVSNGSRRFKTIGLIFFQFFAPKRANAEILTLGLAKIVQDTLRKSTNNVIFRNVYLKELPPENGAIRKTIVAQYEFDEIS